jgi:beta-glucanase (GH16 family)
MTLSRILKTATATAAAALAAVGLSGIPHSSPASPAYRPAAYIDTHTWVPTFDEEFNGTSLDTTKWKAQVTASSAFHNGPECYVNSPNNISVANGVLSLTVRKESAPFVCKSPAGNWTTQYTGASVTSAGLFSQAFGKFEVRAAFPAATVKGLQASLWLWPDNVMKYGSVWPMSGEIDIAEWYSAYANRAIPYIHYVPARVDYKVTNNYCTIKNISAFHSYVVIWTPTTITITFDGRTCVNDSWNPLNLVKPAPFDQPFFVNLTQALGITTNAFNASTTPLPATTQVDYVRVWK